MPVPNRSRNKNGRFRKKRSDAGKERGHYGYSLVELEGTEDQISDTLKEYRKEDIEYIEIIHDA